MKPAIGYSVVEVAKMIVITCWLVIVLNSCVRLRARTHALEEESNQIISAAAVVAAISERKLRLVAATTTAGDRYLK